MRHLTLRSALLLLPVLLVACNPFEVALPESAGPRHRPESSMDIPVAETGSAQVSLGEDVDTTRHCEGPRTRGPHHRH